MSRMKSDKGASVDQDIKLQTIRHAIEIHERLKMSIDEEHAFLMSGDFDRVANIRQSRKQIVNEISGIQKAVRMTSEFMKSDNANPELTVLMERLRESVTDASGAVQSSISDCERERGVMSRKMGALRTSKRAINAYARFGSRN